MKGRAYIVHRMGQTHVDICPPKTTAQVESDCNSVPWTFREEKAWEEEEYRLLLKAHMYNAVNGLYRFVFVLMLLVPVTLFCHMVSVGSSAWVSTRCGGARRERGIFTACKLRTTPYCPSLESTIGRSFASKGLIAMANDGQELCRLSDSAASRYSVALFVCGVVQSVLLFLMLLLEWRLFLRATRRRTALALLGCTACSAAVGLTIALLFAKATACGRKPQPRFFEPFGDFSSSPTCPSGFEWGFSLYVGALGLHGLLLGTEALLVRFGAEVRLHATALLLADHVRRSVQRQLEEAVVCAESGEVRVRPPPDEEDDGEAPVESREWIALSRYLQLGGAGEHPWHVAVAHQGRRGGVARLTAPPTPPDVVEEHEDGPREPSTAVVEEDGVMGGRTDWEDGPGPYRANDPFLSFSQRSGGEEPHHINEPSYAAPVADENSVETDDWRYDTKTDLMYSAKCNLFWDPSQKLYYNRFLQVWQYSSSRMYEVAR